MVGQGLFARKSQKSVFGIEGSIPSLVMQHLWLGGEVGSLLEVS